MRAFGIEEAQIADPITLARFRSVVETGYARYKISLRQKIKARGERTTKSAGSVNALALQARNHLDFDKQIPTQETEPDLATARPRLRELLVNMAGARSEIERKRITPLELIRREAEVVEAALEA